MERAGGAVVWLQGSKERGQTQLSLSAQHSHILPGATEEFEVYAGVTEHLCADDKMKQEISILRPCAPAYYHFNGARGQRWRAFFFSSGRPGCLGVEGKKTKACKTSSNSGVMHLVAGVVGVRGNDTIRSPEDDSKAPVHNQEELPNHQSGGWSTHSACHTAAEHESTSFHFLICNDLLMSLESSEAQQQWWHRRQQTHQSV